MSHPLLKSRNLNVRFSNGVRAVRDVNLRLQHGEVVALVGESGCGKSALARALIGLHEKRAEVQGEIWLEERELLSQSEAEWCRVRGSEIAMVFQDPMAALNPTMRVGRQLTEGLRLHRALSRKEARNAAIELLQQVGIPHPEHCFSAYPHQLSGGMGQRVMIAIALACDPSLLIADEPTTALDATIQTQILRLLKELQQAHQMAILLITHDLSSVAGFCDRILVMYAGQIVEEGTVDQIFYSPSHPYTASLLRSLPSMEGKPRDPLPSIAGVPPTLNQPILGCPFAPRCTQVQERCLRTRPPMREVGHEHQSLCWLPMTEGCRATSQPT